MKKCIFIFTLFTVVFTTSLFGQKNIKVSGNVTDGEGKPLDLATIAVEGSILGTLTDGKGHYTLYVPTKDSVAIVFSCIGYKTTRRVLADPENDFTLNVSLRSTEWLLDEVTVTRSRPGTGTMEEISVDGIKLIPDASGGNVESYIIIAVPGVYSSNELSSQYSVRGGNFDENLVYVNGIEVYRPLLVRSGQQEGLSFINSDMVSDLRFSSGGFEAKYGDKMSSVLDIQYKKPERPFESSVSASLLGASAYVGQKTGNFSQLHGFRYKRATSLLGTLDTKGEYDPNFIDYQMFMTYEFIPKWEASLLGNFSRNQYNFVPQSRSTSFGTIADARQFTVYFDGQERDQFLTGFGAFSLSNTSIKDTKLDFTISSFTTNEQETYDVAGEYWLNELEMDSESNVATEGENLAVGTYHEHARNRLSATVTAISHKGTARVKGNELAWGLTYQWEKIDDRIREWERRDSAGYNWPHDGQAINMAYNLFSKHKMNSTRFQAYLQDTHKFRIREGFFSVAGGVRAGYWDFNDEWIVSPRFNFSFRPNWKRDFVFRLSTGMYYQSPFYKELRGTEVVNGNSFVRLNDQIKSQRSFQVVAGMDYTFRAMESRRFKFTSEVYYKNLSNLIPYNTDNVQVRYAGENLSSGYAMGLDMKIFGEFVPGTDSWLTLSLMKSQETINGVKVPRPTEQLYNISLFFQDYFPGYPKWRMQLKGYLTDGLPFSAPNAKYEERIFRTSPYRRVDIGISRQLISEDDRPFGNKSGFIRNMWIGADVFNLLDISNVNSYYWITDVYNQQYAIPNYLTGRQINVRLTMDF